MKFKVNYTLKMIPAYSLMLLFVSYYCLASYYDYYGIEISSYIEPTELFVIALPVFKDFFYVILVIVLIFLMIPVLLGFIAIGLRPKRKMIKIAIANDLESRRVKKKNDTNRQANVDEIDQDKILQDVEQELGYHLIDDIQDVFKQWKFNRKFFASAFRILVIVGISGSFIFMFAQDLLKNIRFIRLGDPQFYNDPKSLIANMVASSIFCLFLVTQLFAPKFLWHTYFKLLVTEKVLPVTLLALYIGTSLLYNYASYLRVSKGSYSEEVRVFIGDRQISTSKSGYHLIGRTRNFMFFTDPKRFRVVNVAEADSIIVTDLRRR